MGADDDRITPPPVAAVPPIAPSSPPRPSVAIPIHLPSLDPPPTISIAPSASDASVHVLAVAPGTTLRSDPPPPPALGQLLAVVPDVAAIVVFGLWVRWGSVTPAAAAGFITALIVARVSPAEAPGARAVSGLQTMLTSAFALLTRRNGKGGRS